MSASANALAPITYATAPGGSASMGPPNVPTYATYAAPAQTTYAAPTYAAPTYAAPTYAAPFGGSASMAMPAVSTVAYAQPVAMPPMPMSARGPYTGKPPQPHPTLQPTVVSQTASPPTRLPAKPHEKPASYVGVHGAPAKLITEYTNYQHTHLEPQGPHQMVPRFVPQSELPDCPMPRALAAFDTNHDGRLSRTEILRAFDTNHDGRLSAQEQQAVAGYGIPAATYINKVIGGSASMAPAYGGSASMGMPAIAPVTTVAPPVYGGSASMGQPMPVYSAPVTHVAPTYGAPVTTVAPPVYGGSASMAAPVTHVAPTYAAPVTVAPPVYGGSASMGQPAPVYASAPQTYAVQ